MWLYEGKEVVEADLDNHAGFVYNITNLKTGKKYIGKKLLLHRKTKQVKGKRKRILVESDWKDYYGSNKALLEDIRVQGEKDFQRTILKWCKSKGDASYWELYYQMINHALLDENYYNEYIRVRINSSHVKEK